MRHTSVAAAFLALLLPLSASGHGGGLDRNGCHTNRNTGEYHCHGGPSPSTPPAPTRTPAVNVTPATQRVASPIVTAGATTGARDLVRAAQVLLRALGYKPSLLGSLDERTQAAIRAFQRAENLEADGAVSEYLVLRLAEKVVAKCE